MSKKHLPKSIPDRDYEFEVNVKGSITGQEYEGKFKSRIPNLRTQAMIAKTYAFYNAGFEATLDAQIKNLHRMAAYLKHTITEAPEWFMHTDYGYDLYDENVVSEIYFKVLKYEEEWLNTVWGKDEPEAQG